MDGIGGAIGQVLNDAIKQSNARITAEDYVADDGLIHCAKCGHKKQTRVQMLDKEKIMPCSCKCQMEEYERQVAEEERRKLEKKIELMRREGITDREYEKWTMDADDGANPKMRRLCRQYVDNWQDMKRDNTGLLFYGDVDVGKTFFACAIANAILEKGQPVLISSLPKLMQAMQGFDGEATRVLNMIRDSALVVIDDLGVERESTFAFERVYEIIDTRYKAGKPLIITTNLSLEEIENPKDIRNKRIYSRIKEMCIPVLVTGKHRRAEIGEAKKRIAREKLFGILAEE